MKNLTEREIAHDVKEKLVRIVVDFDTELKTTSGKRLASSQTETSSLPLTNISVSWKCFSSRFDVDILQNLYANFLLSHRENVLLLVFDYDTELKSTAESTRRKTSVLPNGNVTTIGAKRCRYAKVLFQII